MFIIVLVGKMMLNDDSSDEEGGVLYFSRNDSITRTSNAMFSTTDVQVPVSPLTPISLNDSLVVKIDEDDEVFESSVNYEQDMSTVPFGNKRVEVVQSAVDTEKLPEENTFIPWEAVSLMDGLGWDIKEGKMTDVSLIRVSSLLQNLNLQLIVMNKEIIQVEKAVVDAYAQKRAGQIGFEDVNNRLHVSSLNSSLSLHLASLDSSLSRLDLSISNSTHSIVPHHSSALLPLTVLSLPLLLFLAYKTYRSYA